MSEMRQRKGGTMTVDKVDRMDEPKQHVHLHRVVRQGWILGSMTFLGLNLPLIAIYFTLFPSLAIRSWCCFPMAAKSFAGPVSAAVYQGFKAKEWAAGKERWFGSFFVALFVSVSLFFVYESIQIDQNLGFSQCVSKDLLTAVGIGLFGAWMTNTWPQVCYKAGWIDSADPPTPLTGEVQAEGLSPYEGLTTPTQKLVGHGLVAVRVLNVGVLVPVIDTLFFRAFVFRELGVLGAPELLQVISAAALWGCYGMHYKGEWVMKFVFGLILQMTAVINPDTCSFVPTIVAHSVRNLILAASAVSTRKWHRWNV